MYRAGMRLGNVKGLIMEENRKGYYPIGSFVTCKVEERPYSYQYMPEEKKRLFTPGKIGTVAAPPNQRRARSYGKN